jgi:hypothetical protein
MAGPLDSCAISHAWERYHSVNFGAKRPHNYYDGFKGERLLDRCLNQSGYQK